MKGRNSHRVEVKILFAAPAPHGWQIYDRRNTAKPIQESSSGYANETDAWTAGAAALAQVIKTKNNALKMR